MAIHSDPCTPHMNDHDAPQHPTTPKPSPWDVLSKQFPTHSKHHSWWWNLTGSHLATLLANSNYTLSQQYEALLFHYRTVVP